MTCWSDGVNKSTSIRLAAALEKHGLVYIQKPGYIRIHVYSRDLALIDSLVRSIGRVRKHMKGRTRDWCWAKQAEMREYLPQIVPHIKDTDRRFLYVLVYRWASSHGPSKSRRLEEVKVLLNGLHPRKQR